MTQMAKFQFHNGSIKSSPASVKVDAVINGFNSTMVRLKEEISLFSMNGSIGFNSTMVRLKVAALSWVRGFSLCFNSTMVRLKERPHAYQCR